MCEEEYTLTSDSIHTSFSFCFISGMSNLSTTSVIWWSLIKMEIHLETRMNWWTGNWMRMVKCSLKLLVILSHQVLQRSNSILSTKWSCGMMELTRKVFLQSSVICIYVHVFMYEQPLLMNWSQIWFICLSSQVMLTMFKSKNDGLVFMESWILFHRFHGLCAVILANQVHEKSDKKGNLSVALTAFPVVREHTQTELVSPSNQYLCIFPHLSNIF